MNIIKEYCPKAKTCVIRSNSYGSRLSRFTDFVIEAKKDFPNINFSEDDFEIVKYAGERYAKTFGIEFSISNESFVPSYYNIVSQLEYT